jgi:hypothetical protein
LTDAVVDRHLLNPIVLHVVRAFDSGLEPKLAKKGERFLAETLVLIGLLQPEPDLSPPLPHTSDHSLDFRRDFAEISAARYSFGLLSPEDRCF